MDSYLRLFMCYLFYFFASNLLGQTDDCETSTTFEVGDEWTYTEVFQSQAGVAPTKFWIEEEVEWQGRQALLLTEGFFSSREYLMQEEDRVYFWNESLEEYVLNYDFNKDSLYYIKLYDSVSNNLDSTAVFIDSVRVDEIDNRNIQVQYCRSNLGFGGEPFPFKVYRGIGSSILGVRLPTDGLLDLGVYDLRCFESSDCSITFVDFPCDLNTTSVQDLKSSLDLRIHPIPAQDKLYLETVDQNWTYQILNIQGQQMMQGEYQDYIGVETLPSGIYFLQLQQEDDLYQAIKFIKQ